VISIGYYISILGADEIVARPKKRTAIERPIAPLLAYQADPIRESVKRLGRKWTLLILRDMAFVKLDRFGKILRNNPGLTARVLSRRLRQMQDEGLVVRLPQGDSVRYRLTDRGEDAVFILLAFLRYGIKHHVTASSHVGSESH
jgi:DNA-binding HxlR family transcriptional regulator